MKTPSSWPWGASAAAGAMMLLTAPSIEAADPPEVEIQIYGYVKADAAYDSREMSVPNAGKWVNDSERDEFNLYANETRLGLAISHPAEGDLEAKGKVEIDFFGGGTHNNALPKMRHAYVDLSWKKAKFSILAGQFWDVVAPVNPRTLNYAPLWWVGNLGFRRPQLRVTKDLPFADDLGFTLALGGTAGGETYSVYTGQSRGTFYFPSLVDKKRIEISGFGHVGKVRPETGSLLTTWSGGADLVLPIVDWLALKGEFYAGQEVASLLGAVGQDHTSTVDGEALRAIGGWGSLAIGPFGPVSFNLSYAIDVPDEDALPFEVLAVPPDPTIPGDEGTAGTPGGRKRNMAGLANVIVQIFEPFSAGLEGGYWHTTYKRVQGGEDKGLGSIRVQASAIYQF